MSYKNTKKVLRSLPPQSGYRFTTRPSFSMLRGPFYKETDPQEDKAFYFNSFYNTS